MSVKSSVAFALTLLLALAACTAPSATKLNEVRTGMTKAEVISLLGSPDSTSAHTNIEYLTYYFNNASTGGRELPYMVRLVDQHVDSFGRFFPLLEVHERPAAADGRSPALGMGAVMPYSMNTDILTQLQQLKALQDQGVLTEDEFQRAKQRLLAEHP
jgi:hypothetical protein